jgi:GxxExxY protein
MRCSGFRARYSRFTVKWDAPLKQIYKPDFICYGKIILELKAVKDVSPEHRAQVFNYLKATGLRLGLLVNFGHYPKATVERIIL